MSFSHVSFIPLPASPPPAHHCAMHGGTWMDMADGHQMPQQPAGRPPGRLCCFLGFDQEHLLCMSEIWAEKPTAEENANSTSFATVFLSWPLTVSCLHLMTGMTAEARKM